jgi:molecular chaperone GrpE (heat shock protein)
MQPCDHFMFHNQTDPASHHLNMLAEAAHIGNCSKQYVEALVRNACGYFQCSMMPIMNKMEHCMEMEKLDEEAVDAVDALLDQLDNGLI